MRSAVIFFVLLLWPLSLPSAASAAPLLFMARSTRSTTEYAPSRPPHPNMALSRAAGGAAITIRKLTSAKDRQICGYPLRERIKVGESPSFRLRRFTPAGFSHAHRRKDYQNRSVLDHRSVPSGPRLAFIQPA